MRRIIEGIIYCSRYCAITEDISSAAFFIAAALVVPGLNLTIKNVGINSTRDGLLEILKQMGADITLANIREVSQESVCNITVKYSKLKAANIDAVLVPRMVDFCSYCNTSAGVLQGFQEKKSLW